MAGQDFEGRSHMELVVDSCVIISALVRADANHDQAREFFVRAKERGVVLWAPATVLWDVSAVFHHPNKVELGTVASDDHGVKLKFMDVTDRLFYDTQARTHLRLDEHGLIHNRSSIRGPDHVFLSCALAKRLPLITWDGRIREQASRFGVAVLAPDEFIAGKQPGVTAPVLTHEEGVAAFQRWLAERLGTD
jgi:predicted nucleic acid-binding protein